MSQAITDDLAPKRGESRPRIFHHGDRVTFSLDTTLGRTDPMIGYVQVQDIFGFVRVETEAGYPFVVPASECELVA
jgi:hypothetical protein